MTEAWSSYPVEPAPGVLTLTLGDVMGKGLSAALLMATVRAALAAVGGTSSPACGSTAWGSGERADIPTKYVSADGKTFYLFSSGGDCLSIARGVLR